MLDVGNELTLFYFLVVFINYLMSPKIPFLLICPYGPFSLKSSHRVDDLSAGQTLELTSSPAVHENHKNIQIHFLLSAPLKSLLVCNVKQL